MKTYLFLILACTGLVLNNVYAQQVVSSAGSHAKGTTVELSWTIGEPVIETFLNGNFILTQGFNQSNLTVTAIDEITLPEFELVVFPNPVLDKLNVEIRKGELYRLSYALYTVDGKILSISTIDKLPGQINMEAFSPGNYLLKISGPDRQPLQNFKIVKSQNP